MRFEGVEAAFHKAKRFGFDLLMAESNPIVGFDNERGNVGDGFISRTVPREEGGRATSELARRFPVRSFESVSLQEMDQASVKEDADRKS